MCTDLKDQEAVVVEVNATPFEQRLYFGIAARFSVDSVLACVVLVRSTSHDELRPWNEFKGVRTRLSQVSIRLSTIYTSALTRSIISRKCTSTLHSSRSG